MLGYRMYKEEEEEEEEEEEAGKITLCPTLM
jgi:hypothetical protein